MVDADWTPYKALGDEGALRMVERFYHYMDTLPEAAGVRAMHKADLSPMTDKLATFLIGWMGGPSRYAEKFGGSVHMPGVHAPFPIGRDEADAWLLCMQKAVDEVAPAEPENFSDLIMERMGQMCEMLINR